MIKAIAALSLSAMVTVCLAGPALKSTDQKALAQAPIANANPIGNWLTIDDHTQKARSIIKIYKQKGGALAGKVVTGFYSPSLPWRKYCDDCIEPFKDKPIAGMTIMQNYRLKRVDGKRYWMDGRIFDVDSGSHIYGSKLWLSDKGQKLHVQGYVLMFFRTQVWERLSNKRFEKLLKLSVKQKKEHPFSDVKH